MLILGVATFFIISSFSNLIILLFVVLGIWICLCNDYSKGDVLSHIGCFLPVSIFSIAFKTIYYSCMALRNSMISLNDRGKAVLFITFFVGAIIISGSYGNLSSNNVTSTPKANYANPTTPHVKSVQTPRKDLNTLLKQIEERKKWLSIKERRLLDLKNRFENCQKQLKEIKKEVDQIELDAMSGNAINKQHYNNLIKKYNNMGAHVICQKNRIKNENRQPFTKLV
jgi:hypothetical protein